MRIKILILFAKTLVRTPLEDQRVALDLLNAMHFDQLTVASPDRWAATIRNEMRVVGEELRAAQLAVQGGEAGA